MTKKQSKKAVFAAGCVVWRYKSEDGTDQKLRDEASAAGVGGVGVGGVIELLVIHRPRYDDWSFPKGKRDKGEEDTECALREVEEETGVTGSLGHELQTVYYQDHKGRDKTVRYWTLEDTATDRSVFEANDEVDEIEWLSPEEAARILTYEYDRGLIDQLLELLV